MELFAAHILSALPNEVASFQVEDIIGKNVTDVTLFTESVRKPLVLFSNVLF